MNHLRIKYHAPQGKTATWHKYFQGTLGINPDMPMAPMGIAADPMHAMMFYVRSVNYRRNVHPQGSLTREECTVLHHSSFPNGPTCGISEVIEHAKGDFSPQIGPYREKVTLITILDRFRECSCLLCGKEANARRRHSINWPI